MTALFSTFAGLLLLSASACSDDSSHHFAELSGDTSTRAPTTTYPFDQYPADLYTGPLSLPSWIYEEDGIWRDDLRKMVEPPRINLGGRYYVALHSCGTGCRYYTITDLSTGRDLETPDIFIVDEENRTVGSRSLEIVELLYRPDSRLIVARLTLGKQGVDQSCMERFFLLGETGEFEVVGDQPCTSDT